MKRKKENAIRDAFFIAVSLYVAYYLVQSGLVERLTESFGSLSYLGIFLAGVFFTTVFTTAPSIVILSELAQVHSVVTVALLGAFGAVAGDYLIFRFVRDHVSEDIQFLMRYAKIRRLPKIFRTRLFHSLMPLLGALIIASPFPDELGLALLGLSKMNNTHFLMIAFTMNALGILAIGLVANALP
jgi:hypothetical protein